MQVLIVEDDTSARSFLQKSVETLGYECRVAMDGEEGLERFEAWRPDLVLTDIRMPKVDGLQLLSEIRKISPDVIVIVMTGYGSETYAMEALRLRANDYLQKPVRHQQINNLLRKYEVAISSRDCTQAVAGLDVNRQLEMRFGNDRNDIPRIANYLVNEIKDLADDETLLSVRLGLIELLMNAVEHGNLGVTYEEKSEALEEGGPEAVDRLCCRRAEEPDRAARQVFVRFEKSRDRAEWMIEDEGEGFDYKAMLEKPGEEQALSMHGRGIFLSRFQFDELEYQGRGNVVRVVKRFPNLLEIGAD